LQNVSRKEHALEIASQVVSDIQKLRGKDPSLNDLAWRSFSLYLFRISPAKDTTAYVLSTAPLSSFDIYGSIALGLPINTADKPAAKTRYRPALIGAARYPEGAFTAWIRAWNGFSFVTPTRSNRSTVSVLDYALEHLDNYLFYYPELQGENKLVIHHITSDPQATLVPVEFHFGKIPENPELLYLLKRMRDYQGLPLSVTRLKNLFSEPMLAYITQRHPGLMAYLMSSETVHSVSERIKNLTGWILHQYTLYPLDEDVRHSGNLIRNMLANPSWFDALTSFNVEGEVGAPLAPSAARIEVFLPHPKEIWPGTAWRAWAAQAGLPLDKTNDPDPS